MDNFSLTKEEKIFLLNLARSTIRSKTHSEEVKTESLSSDSLNMSLGVFVTLHKNDQLRGCIGYVEGVRELFTSVKEMANAAAFDDPRFPPVDPDEVGDLDIEISVLSPLYTITDISEIAVGQHGLIIEKGLRRWLLLPQVAIEYGWDRETFLSQTCLKAGLPTHAWQEADTKIQTFSAEIFSESDFR